MNIWETCWLWNGSRQGQGYGMYYSKGKRQLAHRLAFEIYEGVIPNGMQLDHLCRQRGCVNPKHLRITDIKGNVLAPGSKSPSAICARQLECRYGHAFDAMNTYYYRNKRYCKACGRFREIGRWDRRKEKYNQIRRERYAGKGAKPAMKG